MSALDKAIGAATNILTATPDEAAIIIACALASARDLRSLAVALPLQATQEALSSVVHLKKA